MQKRIRLAVLLLMLVIGVTSLFAAPDHEIYITYYTDATYTDECGYYAYTCFGPPQRSGCQTAYYSVEEGGDC